MYHHFYHLKHDPFADTPDPEFLFLSPSHKTALQTILHGIEKRRGWLAIFGAAGLGKTTLLRAFLEGIHEQQHLKTVQIFYPKISCQDLFDIVYRGLGLNRTTDDPAELFLQLQEALIAEYNQGWNVALLVDDAQDMAEQTLEHLLRLANLKSSTDVHLLQIVLVGLPSLRRTLSRPQFRPFATGKGGRVTLVPLSAKESLDYIRHRLAKVLVPEETLFMPGALKQLIRCACGNPRMLNTLCANVLITGVLREQKPISLALVQEVIAESEVQRARPYARWGGITVAVALLAAGVGLGWQWYWRYDPKQAAPEPAHSVPLKTASPTLPVVSLPVQQDRTESEGSAAVRLRRPAMSAPKDEAVPPKRGLTQREAVQREPAPRVSPRPPKPPDRTPTTEKVLPTKPALQEARAPRKKEVPQGPAARTDVAPTVRVLSIHSNPDGATVTIDRKMAGRTPLTVQLVTGVHTISLEKSGYSRMSYDINLLNLSGNTLYYDLHMEPGSW
jgi:general secretion pathway protein A